jgi:5-methylcytosine-specific restriction endonuclease McrA
VRKRDKDICAFCKFDLKEAEKKWWREKPDYSKEGWAAHQRWESRKPRVNYDHIIPFSEGGMTVLENIRTLCEECHKKRTREWHKQRTKNPNQTELIANFI